jgi:hypothetical protein
LEAALSADEAPLALALYADWPGGAGRFWSGVGARAWDGEQWTGVGTLIDLDKVAESLSKNDIGMELKLNYLDDAVRNEIVTTDPVGMDASLFMWLLDPAAGTVTEGYEIFPGFIDEISIEDSGSTGAITVRLASELARLSKRRWLQLSHAHQQYLFPGDLGMEFATRMDEPLLWGRKPVQTHHSSPRQPSRHPDTPTYHPYLNL